MKNLTLLLFILLGCTGVAYAGDTIPENKIVRFLELSQVEKQFGAAIDQMIDMQKNSGQYEGLTDDFWDEFSRSVHEDGFESLMPKLIEIYQKHYTEAEVDHQIAYLENPLTQKILDKQPLLMQESMQIGAEWGQELGMKIVQRLLEKTEGEH